MVARLMFAIVILHTWMNVALTAEVPAGFIGIWAGNAGFGSFPSTTWTSVISITGGKDKSSIGIMHVMSSRGWGYAIELGLREQDIKLNEKPKEIDVDGDVLFAKGIYSFGSTFRRISGKFKFTIAAQETGQPGELVAEMTWLNERGDFLRSATVVQKRSDDGSMAEKYRKCRGKSPVSPSPPPCKKRKPKKG